MCKYCITLSTLGCLLPSSIHYTINKQFNISKFKYIKIIMGFFSTFLTKYEFGIGF